MTSIVRNVVYPTNPTSHTQVTEGEWLARPDAHNLTEQDNKRYIHFFPDEESFSLCGRRFAPESYLLYTLHDRLIHRVDDHGVTDSWPAPDHQVCCPKCYVMQKITSDPRFAYTPGDSAKAEATRRTLGDRVVLPPDASVDIETFVDILDNPTVTTDDGAIAHRYSCGLVLRQKIVDDTLYLFTDAPAHLTRITSLTKVTAGEMRNRARYGLRTVTFVPYPHAD